MSTITMSCNLLFIFYFILLVFFILEMPCCDMHLNVCVAFEPMTCLVSDTHTHTH